MCMMAVCIIVHSWAAAIVSVVGLLERLCRLCLLCVLWCGAISGDIAATGACVVWSVGLHGSTMTVCRAFSMLVTVGLDAGFVGADVRTYRFSEYGVSTLPAEALRVRYAAAPWWQAEKHWCRAYVRMAGLHCEVWPCAA